MEQANTTVSTFAMFVGKRLWRCGNSILGGARLQAFLFRIVILTEPSGRVEGFCLSAGERIVVGWSRLRSQESPTGTPAWRPALSERFSVRHPV